MSAAATSNPDSITLVASNSKTGNVADFRRFLTTAQRKSVFEQFLTTVEATDGIADAYIIVDGVTTKLTYRNGVVAEDGVSAPASVDGSRFALLLNNPELATIPSFSKETEDKISELRRQIGKLTKKLMNMRANKNRAAYLAKKNERQDLIDQLVAVINEADPINGFFSATKSMLEHSDALVAAKRQAFSDSLDAIVKEMYGESFTLTEEQKSKILNLYMLNLMLSGAAHNLNKARPQLIERYLKYHLVELGKQNGLMAKGSEPLTEVEILQKKLAERDAQLKALLKVQSPAAKASPKAPAAKASTQPSKGSRKAKASKAKKNDDDEIGSDE